VIQLKMKPGLVCAALVLAMGSFGSAARADDAADLTAKTTAALAAVASFQMGTQMTVDGPSGKMPMSMSMTIVRPDHFKTDLLTGPMALSTYSVGDGFSYMHIGSGPWQKIAVPAAQVASMVAQYQAMAKAGTLQILPDSVEDGVPVGMYQSTVQAPAMALTPVGPPKTTTMTITCSYDKQTYLTKKCNDSAGQYVITFSHYNDPANVVELPPEAKSATLLTLPASATPAAPAPSL
jgi:hypothetical protein